MKCLECDGVMKARKEAFRYDACGLPGVTLVGVTVSRCPDCGEVEVTIPQIEKLHRAIAETLARKRKRLMPQEVRFLRKWLGLSGVDFADLMGVTPETVSRWEQGATPMGLVAERLLRCFVLTREPESEYRLEAFKGVGVDRAAPVKIGLKLMNGLWRSQSRVPVAAAVR